MLPPRDGKQDKLTFAPALARLQAAGAGAGARQLVARLATTHAELHYQYTVKLLWDPAALELVPESALLAICEVADMPAKPPP